MSSPLLLQGGKLPPQASQGVVLSYLGKKLRHETGNETKASPDVKTDLCVRGPASQEKEGVGASEDTTGESDELAGNKHQTTCVKALYTKSETLIEQGKPQTLTLKLLDINYNGQ